MVKQSDRPTLGQLRRARNLTQQNVADSLGVASKTVSDWERGVKEPHLPVLKIAKMMELYGCDTIYELVDAVAVSRESRGSR